MEAGCQAKNRIRQGSEPLSEFLYHALAAEVTLFGRTGASAAEPPSKKRAIGRDSEVIMFAFFRRRTARRYVWTPAIDFSDRRIAATLMTFGGR
jgi:hypothetical protein